MLKDSTKRFGFKIFFFWVPGGLFSFQEGPFTQFLGYYLTGNPLFSCNITSLGELALMMGWPGVLAFGVSSGIVTYLLDIRHLRSHLNLPFLIFAIILLQIMRGPFYYFLSQILLLSLAWWLIYKFLIKKRSSA